MGLAQRWHEIATAAVPAGAPSGEVNSDDGSPGGGADTAPAGYEDRDGFDGLRLAAIWQPPQRAITVGALIA